MMCEACERGDHDQCGMQTWCECDCEGYGHGQYYVPGPEVSGNDVVDEMGLTRAHRDNVFEFAEQVGMLLGGIRNYRDHGRQQVDLEGILNMEPVVAELLEKVREVTRNGEPC